VKSGKATLTFGPRVVVPVDVQQRFVAVAVTSLSDRRHVHHTRHSHVSRRSPESPWQPTVNDLSRQQDSLHFSLTQGLVDLSRKAIKFWISIRTSQENVFSCRPAMTSHHCLLVMHLVGVDAAGFCIIDPATNGKYPTDSTGKRQTATQIRQNWSDVWQRTSWKAGEPSFLAAEAFWNANNKF